MLRVSFTQAMAVEDGRPSSPLPPLPMECVPHILTPQEQSLLYDYVVEVCMNSISENTMYSWTHTSLIRAPFLFQFNPWNKDTSQILTLFPVSGLERFHCLLTWWVECCYNGYRLGGQLLEVIQRIPVCIEMMLQLSKVSA